MGRLAGSPSRLSSSDGLVKVSETIVPRLICGATEKEKEDPLRQMVVMLLLVDFLLVLASCGGAFLFPFSQY